MKKLLMILVMVFWCNVGVADSPFNFFGIELASNADKYTNSKLEESFNDNHSTNKYSYNPPKDKTNNLFSKYLFETSAVSNTVVEIYAESPYTHSKRVCQQKMLVLRNKVFDLKKKFFSDKYKIVKSGYSETIVPILEKPLNDVPKRTDPFFDINITDLNAPEDITNINFVCWMNNDIPRWRAYIRIRSDSLDRLAGNEHKTYKIDSVNTKGF